MTGSQLLLRRLVCCLLKSPQYCPFTKAVRLNTSDLGFSPRSAKQLSNMSMHCSDGSWNPLLGNQDWAPAVQNQCTDTCQLPRTKRESCLRKVTIMSNAIYRLLIQCPPPAPENPNLGFPSFPPTTFQALIAHSSSHPPSSLPMLPTIQLQSNASLHQGRHRSPNLLPSRRRNWPRTLLVSCERT